MFLFFSINFRATLYYFIILLVIEILNNLMLLSPFSYISRSQSAFCVPKISGSLRETLNEIFALALATFLLLLVASQIPPVVFPPGDCIPLRITAVLIILFPHGPQAKRPRIDTADYLPRFSWGRRHNAEDLKIGDFYARRSKYVSR